MVYFIEVVVKVAIIGAGIAGIGSSVEFSKNNVEHIIIEARNRTGGRITSAVLDGVTVQLGAEEVHQTKQENLIADVINEQGWEYKKILLFQNRSFVQPGRGQLTQAVISRGNRITEDVKKHLCRKDWYKQANKTHDENLQTATDRYFGKIKRHTAEVDVALWQFQYIGTFYGADLKNLRVNRFCIQAVDQAGLYVKQGYSYLVQSIFSRATPKSVNLNQKVTKIDYSGEIVKIYTEDKVFLAKKAIVTIPLGVLKQNNVQFVPQLSQERKDAIQKMAVGIFNKVLVSFETPFWDTSKIWIGFVSNNGRSRYSMARYISDKGKYILALNTYATDSIRINKMTDEQIKEDVTDFLMTYYPNASIVIRDLIVTRWNEDPFARESFSYQAVGTNPYDLITTYCAPLDNKVWFAGEHCNPTSFAYSHSAYQTGVWAAGNITQLFSS